MSLRGFPSVIALLFATVLSGQQIDAAPNGFRASAGQATLEVTALRSDVLRVRMWQNGAVPEDASWAVLPEARTSRVAVTAQPGGFDTRALRVRVDASLQLTVTDLAGTVLQQDAAPVLWDGTRFEVRKQNSADDHFFGLGDKPGPLDRRGEAFTMWNSDSFGWQESTDPIYKSIPFFLDVNRGRTLGVFLDNTFRSNFDFGRADAGRYTFGAPGGPLDYYLMYGPEPKQVLAAWAWLAGPTPLPPRWALGFQQSRWSYYPESQVREIADRLRADHIPSDVIWLDIDYQDRDRPFTIDQQGFPDFAGMVKDLAAKDFKVVAITDLHIAKQAGTGYAPYDSGVAGDEFVKNPDGSTYVGAVWPGPAVFPDFTRQQTRAWWGTLYKQLVDDGVSGFWNDMNEPAVFNVPSKTMPDDVRHRIDEPGFKSRTANHLEIHNVYGMQNARATADGLLALRPNERPFVMTRASFAGGHRSSVTWTGDNRSTWNHLRMSIPQLENLGLSGFSLAGADVGGFAGSPPPDLLTKWLEVAAFQPIDRDHSSKGTRMHEVWVDGPEQEAIRRRFIEERYRLLPYFYTTLEEGSQDGLSFNRPLFVEFPHATVDGSPFDQNDSSEFMVGSALLVAPSPSPEEVAPYTVALPPGVWYDYWTGQRYTRGQPLTTIDAEQREKVLAQERLLVTPKLEELPVYVRGGSILPIAPLTQSTAEVPQGPLTLRVYPPLAGTACEGEVYADDGHTFDYRRGAYARRRFHCTVTPDGAVRVEIGKQEGSFKPWWQAFRVEVAGWVPRSGQGTSGGRSYPLTQGKGMWGVSVPAAPGGISVLLQ